MPKYSEYIAIFQTGLVHRPYPTLVLDPIKVEVRNGPLTFPIPVFLGGSVPAGEQHRLTDQRELRLVGDATYLIITARVPHESGKRLEEVGQDSVDRAIAMLCLLYSPELFSHPLYRGLKAHPERMELSGWVKLTHPVAIDDVLTTTGMQTIRQAVATDSDLNTRFGSMARFLTKAATYFPGEERFVMLWTILEIFPMKDTTDIAPIADYLAPLLGRDASEVKSKLGIGRLFAARSDIVHNGVLPIPISELGSTMDRLEAICLCIMRRLGGLPYNGSLDAFFDDPVTAGSPNNDRPNNSC